MNEKDLLEEVERLKQEKYEALKAKKAMREGLPHLYGFKDYKWSREFLDSTNKTLLCTAANQIGKSTTLIRKVVDYATGIQAWPTRFRKRPRQFWYLYPTAQIASAEYHTKWRPDILPRNEFKNHPQYGWKAEFKNRGDISAIYFNSGVALYFKTYAQDVTHLQAGTVDFVACDEELPEELFDEIQFRRNAVEGYFASVFTATLGQELWRLAMEPNPGEKEFLPFAHKIQVSLFDCQKFIDGTPSHWSIEKINHTVAMCKNEMEVLKRVYGRFVKDSGLKYSGFTRTKNVKQIDPPPAHWPVYAGVDIGAAGEDNHPSAITFVAVRPDYKYGVVFKHWRGDDRLYTAGDVVNEYISLSQGLNVVGCFYDYAAKDFETIANRMGVSVIKAEKRHDIGEHVINVLFKNDMLDIMAIPENEPVIRELLTVALGVHKQKLKDDSVDSLRYALTKIPFDFTAIGVKLDINQEKPKPVTPWEQANLERNRDRFRMMDPTTREKEDEIGKEITHFNDLIGTEGNGDFGFYDDFSF